MRVLVVLLSVVVAVEATLLLTPSGSPPASQPDKVLIAERLAQVSVNVHASKGMGTGVLLTRHTKDGKKLHLVLTAAHVVACNRAVTPSAEGPKISFEPLKVVVTFRHNGEVVRQNVYAAEIIQYSNAETGRDLALLKIVDPTFPDIDTPFDLSVLRPGTDLFHCGNMFGLSESFSAGVVSQTGRRIMGKLFDQVSMTIYPGSSGGGVFTADGRCIGIAVLLRAPGLGFIVPAREVDAWANRAGCRWVTNPSIKIDSEKLAKWPIENDGTALPACVEDDEPVCGRH